MSSSPSHSRCGKCLSKPPKFDRTLAPMSYEFPVNFLISQLKHQAKPDLLQLCSELFVHRFKAEISQQPPQLIIPVPLHRSRLYSRGYNQAAEWARYLSQQLDIPYDQNICKRGLATPHQQGLSAKQRRRNLAKAFSVEAQQKLHHVAIVDDVMTTGTTLDLLAHELRKSGIERIDAWCFARTPSQR
ncbi:MAG: ComF family protein [Motiliproteus sp.]